MVSASTFRNPWSEYLRPPTHPRPPLRSRSRIQSLIGPVEIYRRWIDTIPLQTLTASQVTAFAGLKQLKAVTIPISLAPDKLTVVVQRIFGYLDHPVFSNRLSARCRVLIGDPSTMKLLGECQPTWRSNDHQRVLACSIRINPDPAIRGNSLSTDDLEDAVSHEMAHASLLCDLDCRSLTPEESIQYLGVTGHGELFVRLVKAANVLLAKHLRSGIDAAEWSRQCLASAIALEKNELLEVSDQIQHYFSLPQRSDQILTDILNQSIVIFNKTSARQARLEWVRELRMSGRSELEIALMVVHCAWPGHWCHLGHPARAKHQHHTFPTLRY